jgi:RimJ/RimL family protein N-acetyltransferase
MLAACEYAPVIPRPDGWGPVLSGPRVRVEPIDSRLARAMLAGVPQPDLAWAEGFPMTPVLDIARVIAAAPEPLGPFLAYVIVSESDGKAIGDAGFHGPPSADGELEVGYALVPAARGMGLAGEAVGLLIEWARSQPGVRTITARVDSGNAASERLLTRLGFTPDGEHDGMRRFVLRPSGA